MTSRSEQNTSSAADWAAAEEVAARVGANTRRLIALRDPAAIAWVLQVSREHTGVASLTYYELAVMLGHRGAKVTAAAYLDWNGLLREVGELQAAVTFAPRWPSITASS
jgi:hypothetical protein